MSATHDSVKHEGGRFAPLPDTATAQPDESERAVLEGWRERGVFRQVEAARAGAAPFVFWEGPPTANGRPGIHHVMARTIKDTVCRYQTMRGKRVVRKAGWDTHGLPVELEVEKALGISGKPQIEEYGVAAFNAKCRESVWTYRKEWEDLSERMGYWLDYDDPYVTYHEDYVESVWHVLARFHAAGLVYRGKRVVPYCGRCGTGLSSHELGQPGAYKDIKDPSVVLRFRLRDAAGDEPESLLAWTTTPWTLPSNVALAVHPEVEYVRARVALPAPKGEEPGSRGSEVVWIARPRAAAVLGEGFEELDARPGRALVGAPYLPLFDALPPRVDPGAWEPEDGRLHRVVAADYVTTEDGTGIVHQAPSYGADDWATAAPNRLPVLQAVGPEGRFVEEFGPVPAGTFFKEADDALMDDLKARGLLFRKAREEHSYPHCWRCETPLFYFATPAWYIRTSSYKERMLEYNRRCDWVPPEVGEKRLGDWLENNIDWNISRDRYWGTPLPFWVCEGCEAERAIGSVAELRELVGELPEGFDNHKPAIDELTFACQACGGVMRRTKAVVDCWFDSGSMPFAQYHYPFEGSAARVAEQFPADFIAEGLDQTRGWFYSLLAIGAFLAEDDPRLPAGTVYRACVVNGLVLDKDGVKMSKRLGNVVDPWEAIAAHGIDAVRWYMLASGAPWLPKRVDLGAVLEVRRRFLGTLANSYRFFAEYARIDAFDPGAADVPPLARRPEIDRWLASRTQSLVARFRACMDAYDLAGACRAVEAFTVDELSNWYIRRNRRRFWKGEVGPDKLSAFATLHDALRTVALLAAPAAPFLTELLWERLGDGAGSVHAALVPEPREEEVDAELEAAMDLVVRVVEMGRSLREKAGLRIRQPLRGLHLRSADEATLALLRTPFAEGQILDELNLKGWASLGADDGRLCTLKARPNFRVLGKRLGPRMKAAAARIGALGADEVARLRDGGVLELELDGEALQLGPEDVEVVVETQADFDVETDGRVVVYLDAELDDALLAEGVAREIVSRVNALRKQRGLAVEQRIRLALAPEGALVERALAEHGALIADETLAAELAVRAPESGDGEAVRWELGDGRALAAALAPA